MYQESQLYLLTLKVVAYEEEVLWYPTVQCPLFTRTRSLSGVFHVGCIGPTILAEPCLSSVQMTTVAHFAYGGQDLLPVLLQDQSGTTVGLLLGSVSSQTRCLPSSHLLQLWSYQTSEHYVCLIP